MKNRILTSFLALAVIVALGARGNDRQSPRAKAPAFSKEDRTVFFDDARAMLVGARPDFAAAAAAIVAQSSQANRSGSDESASSEEWSQLISTETLESEIKRQSLVVSKSVDSASAFKGGGYQDCRQAFSILAAMFAVTAQHNNDARWQDRAAGLAVLFSRAGSNCKVGTDGSYREASARAQDLADLVRGGRPEVPKVTDELKLGAVADLSPLMKRMETAFQDKLKPLVAGERGFMRAAEDAKHEAQLLAVLAEISIREGSDYEGDEEFAQFARQLRAAAKEIAQAADAENFAPVGPAYGKAGKACSNCHEGYRG